MTTSAQYASTPNTKAAAIAATANTARDGTGTLSTVWTPGASGGRLDDFSITAVGTTTAGMLRLFKHNGTSAFLLTEIPVTAITPSGTVAGFISTNLNKGWIFQTGETLRIGTHNAEAFNFVPTRAGDF